MPDAKYGPVPTAAAAQVKLGPMTAERAEPHTPMIVLPERSVLCAQPDMQRQEELKDAMQPWRVVTVANAFEAIRMSNAEAFDAYVLEYWLPDWSGVALCRHIRKTDPHAPICIYSRIETDEQRKRAKR